LQEKIKGDSAGLAQKSLLKEVQMNLENLLREIDSLEASVEEKHRLKTMWSNVRDNCIRLESLRNACTLKE